MNVPVICCVLEALPVESTTRNFGLVTSVCVVSSAPRYENCSQYLPPTVQPLRFTTNLAFVLPVQFLTWDASPSTVTPMHALAPAANADGASTVWIAGSA